jgi:hypothetical protein
MSGGFEVMDGVLRQQTPQMPIGWFGLTADTLPYTIVGAIDWADVTVSADILLPKSSTGKSTSIGWIGARVSQTAEECDGEAQVENECCILWSVRNHCFILLTS